MTTSARSSRSLQRRGRSARPLAVAALCAAVTAASPTPAQAQTVTDPDAVGDMIRVTNDDRLVPAPERMLNDVSSTTLGHGSTRVSVRVDYVDLQKVGDWQSLELFMVTNERVRRMVSLGAYPRHWSGETEMVNGRYRKVRCAVRHSIDYDANVMTVSLPRRCASNPRWIKFRVGVVAGDERNMYVDDALRDRPISEQDSNFASSGRVYRQATS